MPMHLLRAVVVLWLVGITTSASAQDLDLTPPRAPRYRLDIDVFTPGGFLVVRPNQAGGDAPYVDGFLSGQVGLRVGFTNGSGFYVDPSLSVALIGPLFALVETGYLHRLRITGDDACGLALDLELGVSGGYRSAEWINSLPEAAVVGPNVGVSLDYRVGSTVVGLLVRYRPLYDGVGIEHVASATIRIAVGHWD